MKPGDDLDDPQQIDRIRLEAQRALETAGAMGMFPTPVAQIVEAARHTVAPDQQLDEGFLANMSRRAKGALKRAISKVWAVLDVGARTMHLDGAVHAAKRPFLMLHELGHGLLGWQRDIYAATADCEKTIAPEIADLFERESNAFACEVLFQLDSFTWEAADHEFSIRTPLKLAKRYGASVYSAVRRYVRTNGRSCAVLVLEPPELCDGHGFIAKTRRVVQSDHFRQQFDVAWPQALTPEDALGKIIPVGGRRMSRPRTVVLSDRNGVRHECIAEAFDSTHQVFILILPTAKLTRSVVLIPG